MAEPKSSSGFALRLPRTMRRQAEELAKDEGISLNQLILLAVAEKITRLEVGPPEASSKRPLKQDW